jgi:hypothetical protein
MGYNLATAEGQQARLDEINAKAKVTPIFEFGNEYLYAILRGEAEYDAKLVKIAMHLTQFELAKKAVVANLHPDGHFGERLEAARKRREVGEARQEELIAAARKAGDIDRALELAKQDPIMFEHYDPDPERPNKFVRRFEPQAPELPADVAAKPFAGAKSGLFRRF